MARTLWVVLALVLIAVGAYLFLNRSVHAPGVPGLSGEQTTYTDSTGVFTLTFPSDFTVVEGSPEPGPGWSAPASTEGVTLAKITVPSSYAKGTNFADAMFTVGTSADSTALASCLKNLSGSVATTTVTIGDTTFTKLEFQGAAAGNRYDTTSYRAVRGSQCWAVEYTIHYSVIQNYPAGTREFDETMLAATLDTVVHSFHFLPLH